MASPLPIKILPEDPLLVVPDVKLSLPLTPDVPAFTVRTMNDPLDVSVPSPVVSDTAPPVNGVLSPAIAYTSPPVSVFDLPTDTRMSPPSPCVAAPVKIEIDPEPPLDAVPLEKYNEPLTPDVPAFTLRSTK